MATGKCVPLSSVIQDMDDANKQKLYDAAMACITKFDITDIGSLQMLLLGVGTSELSQMLIGAMRDFATSDLKYDLA